MIRIPGPPRKAPSRAISSSPASRTLPPTDLPISRSAHSRTASMVTPAMPMQVWVTSARLAPAASETSVSMACSRAEASASPTRINFTLPVVARPRTWFSSARRHLVLVPPASIARKRLITRHDMSGGSGAGLLLGAGLVVLGSMAACSGYTLARMVAAAFPTRLHPVDLALIVVYLIGITLFGLRFRSGKDPNTRSLRSYFLADQTIPWWAIALSIVSAETSTLTIISIPGVAFAGDFGFLQIVIGYMLGRIVVALIFLPKYFQGAMLTAYQLIYQRFGPTLHKVTAGLFLLTRAAAEGVRVFAVSIVVGIAIGTRDVLSIAIISALTLLYTFEGGMAAVIWTDVVQMFIYVGGTLVAIATLGAHVPGGWAHIHAVAGAAGKFHMLNFAMTLTT